MVEMLWTDYWDRIFVVSNGWEPAWYFTSPSAGKSLLGIKIEANSVIETCPHRIQVFLNDDISRVDLMV